MIPPDQLIERGIYRLQSRNLMVGAWNPATLGFIGVREKFGSQYLFTEYEHDLAGPPFGTARAVEYLDVTVPDNIPMLERLGIFNPDGREARYEEQNRRYVWADTGEVAPNVDLHWVQNEELFQLLLAYDIVEVARWRKENGY